MLSQTCINLILVVNTKEDISKNVGNQIHLIVRYKKKIVVVGNLVHLIVGYKKILWNSLGTSNCLVFHILQNSMYVQQKKETHSGLKLILSE